MVRLTVRAKPHAKRAGIRKVDGLTVEVALAAAPLEGAANAELLALLSDALGVARTNLRLVRGATARLKMVEVQGLAHEEAASRLAAAARQ